MARSRHTVTLRRASRTLAVSAFAVIALVMTAGAPACSEVEVGCRSHLERDDCIAASCYWAHLPEDIDYRCVPRCTQLGSDQCPDGWSCQRAAVDGPDYPEIDNRATACFEDDE